MKRILFLIFSIFCQGCVSSDSIDFEPTAQEKVLASQVVLIPRGNSFDAKNCKKLGEVKIHATAEGQSAPTVAVRKYKEANLIHHTAKRMDGSITGEAPFNFYDVYRCPSS